MESIILTVISPKQEIIIDKVFAPASEYNCHIQECRVSALEKDYVAFMGIKGNWSDIAKLESVLQQNLIDKDVMYHLKRTKKPNYADNPYLPYVIQVVGLDSPAVINEVTYFFSAQEIQMLDLQIDPFQTSHSDTMMLTIAIRLNIPVTINIADLRERFLLLCDELNIDGIMEPEKR